MTAVPTGSSWGSHLPFWFMLGLGDAESCQRLGKGVGGVSVAFHCCCALQFAPQWADLLPPRRPPCQLTQSLAFTEHYGVWKVNGRSMDEKIRGGLGLMMSLFWVSCFICTAAVIVLKRHSGLLWLVAAFCFSSSSLFQFYTQAHGHPQSGLVSTVVHGVAWNPHERDTLACFRLDTKEGKIKSCWEWGSS